MSFALIVVLLLAVFQLIPLFSRQHRPLLEHLPDSPLRLHGKYHRHHR